MGIPFLSTHALYPIPRPPGVFRRLIATNARLSKRFISRVSGQKNVTRYKMHLGSGSAIRVGAGIYGILKQAQQRMIAGCPPAHLVSRTVRGSWKLDLLCAEPKEKAARAAKLVELAKHEFNRFAHSRIRSFFQTSIRGAHVTDSNGLDPLPSRDFLRQCGLCPRTKVCQLHLADLSFHSQQQPVVGIAWIIDPFSIDQQCSDDATELKQCVPVTAVTRQTRCFNAKHSTHQTITQSAEQTLEARALDSRSRTTKIIVDHLDVLPTEIPRSIGKTVLPPLALKVLVHLIERRLADVYVCAPRQMVCCNFTHRRSPGPSVGTDCTATALAASAVRLAVRFAEPALQPVVRRRKVSAVESCVLPSLPPSPTMGAGEDRMRSTNPRNATSAVTAIRGMLTTS